MDKKKKLRLVLIMPIVGTMVVLGGILTFVLIVASAGEPQVHIEPIMESHAGDVHGTVEGHAAPESVVIAEAAGEGAAMPDMPVASCEFGFLVGLSVQQAEEQVKPLDRPYRILGPDSMATMDYNPDRINIMTDGGGNTVLSVSCG